jgi:hypothetical protein
MSLCALQNFFSILAFLIKIREINSGRFFFSNLTLLSRASPVGMIYKEVTSCVLTQLKGQARAEPMMWRHVGASHAKAGGTTKSHQMTWRDCWEV